MSACPYCFQPLVPEVRAFRCASGKCQPAVDKRASEMAGYPVATTAVYVRQKDPTTGAPPRPATCMMCKILCTQEVCPACHKDLEAGWRDKDVFTMALTGARGAGKSVYITVLVQWIKRFAELNGRTLSEHNQSTQDVYASQYYGQMYGENKCIDGTKPMSDGEDAYQRHPLIFRLSPPPGGRELYLVMRDMAGEDLEKTPAPSQALLYTNFADLTVFLFDPMILERVESALEGLIPALDKGRLGLRAEKVLANLLAQFHTPHGRLALTISKFDALQQLRRAETSDAFPLINPAARFNRDATFSIADPRTMNERPVSREYFQKDSAFLDAEIRSLLMRMNEMSVTNASESARSTGKVGNVRHFAVSSLGDTPQHAERLTVRGISPFRVLDPLLWALDETGRWI